MQNTHPLAWRSLRYAWYVAGLLTLVQIISYLDRYLPSLLLEPIKHDLKLTDFQAGLLLGPAFTLFYVVLGIPLGWLADRASRRALLAIGAAVWCLMTASAAVAGGFLALLVTRLGVGVGEASVAPTSISLLSDYFEPERRARAISLFMSGTFLGAGTAFLFFGPLVHYIESLPPLVLPVLGPLVSWRLCFFLIGVPGLLISLWLWTIHEPRGKERSQAEAGASFGDALAFIASHWRAFTTLFVASACNLTMGALSMWNVALFHRTWGWNVAEVGVAVGVMLLTAGPIGILLGVWRTNRDLAAGRADAALRALFIGLLIGVPAYAIFPLLQSSHLALIALFCSGIGQSMATAAGPAALVVLAPGPIRAQSTAVYYLVINVIAQLIGPPAVGLMTDLMGGPSHLRYAVSIEVLAVGIPSITLVCWGYKAYRHLAQRHSDGAGERAWKGRPLMQGASE